MKDQSSTSATPPQDQNSKEATDQAGSAWASAIRVLNPAAFYLPDFTQLVLDALSKSPLVRDSEAALFEIIEHLGDPRRGVLVAREAGEYVGVAIVENGSSALSPGTVVLQFHNRGSADARKALIEAIAGFAREGGNARIWGIDANQRPAGFARLFRALGPVETHGQLFSFDLTEGEV